MKDHVALYVFFRASFEPTSLSTDSGSRPCVTLYMIRLVGSDPDSSPFVSQPKCSQPKVLNLNFPSTLVLTLASVGNFFLQFCVQISRGDKSVQFLNFPY